MMSRLRGISRILPLFTGLALLAGCKTVVLAPSGDVAARQRDILVNATLLMLIIIIPVMLVTAWFAWHYRASNKAAKHMPDWDHSTKLELAIWGAPVLIIVALGALTWVGTHLLDPWRPLDRVTANQPLTAETEPLKVEVVALDWKWLFIYPDQGIATVNTLAVPVDRPVEFSLTSSSVMNAFYIPAMAGMIYAMPGMETKLHGIFNNPGEYQGLASHYSGAGFSGMRFKTHALDAAGFDAWVAEAKAAGGALDRAKYLELEVPSENVKPMTFADVDPQLFARVVNMCVEQGKICMAEMMALDAQGGTGMAGTMNIASLPADRLSTRRQSRNPVLGWQPFQVSGFCTPEDNALMLDRRADSRDGPVDPAPLRGRGLTRPEFSLGLRAAPRAITQLLPAAADGQDI